MGPKTKGISIGVSGALLVILIMMPGVAHAEVANIPDTFKPRSPIALKETQLRSWYGTSFTFATSYTTPIHRFDGKSIGIEVRSVCAIDNASFSVSLYREGSSLISSATLQANTLSRHEWKNVGSGRYYFTFKTNGRSEIRCEEVAMFSW